MNHARQFALPEFYPIMWRASRSVPLVRSWKKSKRIPKAFRERIMLAISGVNGCAMCSFVHTKIALAEGIPAEQIKQVLGGSYDDVPTEEVVGVLFAQSYAANNEAVDAASTARLVKEYGEAKAHCILQVCQIITFTTVMGITLDGVKQRLTFQRAHNRFYRELLIMVSIFVGFPVLFLYHVIVILGTRPAR
jgi:AhpD family alkylhydroperoxidase